MAGRGVGGADPASRMAYVVKSGDGEQYWVRGNLFGFKASTREVGHGFAVVETTLHPVAAAPAHVHHETDEGVFMIQGRMLVDVGEQRLDLSAGDFAFLPRDIPHRYLPQEPGPVRTLWILSPGGYENYWRDMGIPVQRGEKPPPPTPPDPDYMARLAAKYATEILP